MLTKIHNLIQGLNENGIRYCHWKSNLALAEALSGQTDIDLLVDRRDADSFRRLLGQLCFRPASLQLGEALPGAEHYLGLDHETGALVHVHAYFQVVTGESLAKNYHFPLEKMLLENGREEQGVRLPSKSAELVVFTLRMMLKHTSLVELLLLARDRKAMGAEIHWLLEDGSLERSIELVQSWLPAVDIDLFSACVAALQAPAPLLHRIRLGLRLRGSLHMYARHSLLRASLLGLQKFSIMAFRRLAGSRTGMIPHAGGAVIAFVGPEATGKSTLLAETRTWLGEHYVVEQVHAGKPKSTFLTFLPNLLLPALRSLFPAKRSNRMETSRVASVSSPKANESVPLLFAIRSVLLAHDRRALLNRAFAQAANGSIILCDRYPSLSPDAPDGSQLQHYAISPARQPVQHFLARLEKQMYRQVSLPDLVICLSVPVEVAIQRNRTRGKEEPEEYVRFRHSQTSNPDFGDAPVCRIDTDRPLDQTILEVKRAIWEGI
jgi:thymidylate kinase